MSASRKAKMWSWIAFGAWFLLVVGYVALLAIGFASGQM